MMLRVFKPEKLKLISKAFLLCSLTVSCNSLSQRGDNGYALKKKSIHKPKSSFDIFGTKKSKYQQDVYAIRQDLTHTNSRVTSLEGDVRQIRSHPVLSSSNRSANMTNQKLMNAQTHVVKKGETLTSISRQYGVSINSIVQYNGLANPNKILAGQTLALNSQRPINPSPSIKEIGTPINGQYVVKEGDTISRIAKAHGVSNASLLAANQNIDPNKISAGQKILISDNETEPKLQKISEPAPIKKDEENPIVQNPENPNEIIAPQGHGFYQVSSGDTLHSIAISFGTDTDNLRKLNKISTTESSLQVGDYILVPVPDESLYES